MKIKVSKTPGSEWHDGMPRVSLLEKDWRYIKRVLDAADECGCAGGICGDRRCKTAEALRAHLAKRTTVKGTVT